MNKIFHALGIDYEQWKALTVNSLRLDLRGAQFGRVRVRELSTFRAIAFQLVFYIMLGGGVALAVTWVDDLFVAGLIVMSYVLFMVGSAILMVHNSAVTSPTDYFVLGYQPVTSRTWFAVRLTNMLVHILTMATAVGLAPTIVFFVKHGIAVGAAALLALYACAISISLAIILVYASVLRLLGVRRLKRLVSYLQLISGFLIYGAYFAVAELVSRSTLAQLSLPKTPLLMLYPATWFASYLELAAGRTGLMETLPALASVALIVILASGLRSRLSLDYAQQLGEIASSTGQEKPHTRRAWAARSFRGGEGRAIALVVLGHWRNDMKFRMGVLGLIPVTVLYFIMGIRQGGNAPIADGAVRFNVSMVTLAVMLFCVTIKMHLAHSDAFRASWIYFASPASRTRLIRATKNVLVVFFLIPYLVFVGTIVAWFTHSLSYAVLYVLFTGLMSHLALLVVTFVDPELPFSKPVMKSRAPAALFLSIIVLSLIGGLSTRFMRLIHADLRAAAIAFAIILGVSWLVDHRTRVRVERRAAQLEFMG